MPRGVRIGSTRVIGRKRNSTHVRNARVRPGPGGNQSCAGGDAGGQARPRKKIIMLAKYEHALVVGRGVPGTLVGRPQANNQSCTGGDAVGQARPR